MYTCDHMLTSTRNSQPSPCNAEYHFSVDPASVHIPDDEGSQDYVAEADSDDDNI